MNAKRFFTHSNDIKALNNNLLVEKMQSVFNPTEEEIAYVKKNIPVLHFPKGTLLLREGQISNKCYFNFQGLVRQYYLLDGEEKTTAFYMEGEGISSTVNNGNIPSRYYLECVEDCVLSVMTTEVEAEMFTRFPHFEKMCRVEVEKLLDDYKNVLADYMLSSPEQRYLNLVENKPELLYRVPQYQLASYIGVKPESLSRIRKRLASKNAGE